MFSKKLSFKEMGFFVLHSVYSDASTADVLLFVKPSTQQRGAGHRLCPAPGTFIGMIQTSTFELLIQFLLMIYLLWESTQDL